MKTTNAIDSFAKKGIGGYAAASLKPQRQRDDAMQQKGHLSHEERYRIAVLKQQQLTQKEIADRLDRCPSVISRELKRNKSRNGSYSGIHAHELATQRKRRARRPKKIVDAVQKLVESGLKKQWSPEQISGQLKKEGEASVSHATIYSHMRADRAAGGKLYKELRRGGKPYKKPFSGKRRIIHDQISIDDRPAVVAEKTRIGDWEADTIVGAGQSGCLLVAVERVSQYVIIVKCADRAAKTISAAFKKHVVLRRPLIHTITVDNGREFAYHKNWGKQLKAKVYFAHPYSPWERGMSEHVNGLIRQYLPKKKNFTNVTQTDCKEIMDKLNTRPRKLLGYHTPRQALRDEKIAFGT